MIKMRSKFTLFINLPADSIGTSHTNIVSRAERLCPPLRSTVKTVSLRFYFSSLGVTAILANKRIACALLFVLVESIDL
jgi:hypothetical protein